MHKYFYATSLAACLALAVSSTNAAEPVLLQKTSFTDLQHLFQFVMPNTPNIKTPAVIPGDALRFVREHTDKNKMTHVRMQQEYAGFLVFGGYAITHSTKSAQNLLSAKNDVKVTGVIYQGLKTELGQPAPTFVSQAKVALQKFQAQYQADSVSEQQVIPIVYINDKHQAFWAYKVSLVVSHADSIPERPTAILDAQTFKPLVQWNDLKTLYSAVNGVGFGGNFHKGKYIFGRDFPFLSISRDPLSSTCYMENKDVKVVDMAQKYSGPNNTMRFSCYEDAGSRYQNAYWTGYRGNGYDRRNGAYSPSNDALYAGQVIKNLYMEWYDLPVLISRDKPMKLIMRVHFGRGYENAYWDGRQMTFGDGDTMMHPLVSLGIGAHEISHGFTEQHSNLEYFGQSGGMNESFSDMAAQAAEYYSEEQNSWKIGSEVMKEDSGYEALRFMDLPSRDGNSIDRADQYNDNLDVHFSSGVYNRLFYLLANQPEWDVRQAFYVMVKANMDYWTPYSDFEEGGCGIINAANDLGFSMSDVKQALDQVAISYQTCDVS